MSAKEAKEIGKSGTDCRRDLNGIKKVLVSIFDV
jgi:hypothetical protein